MRTIVCGIALLMATGCGLLREPTALGELEPQIGVYGVLTAGADTASILVVRFPGAWSFGSPAWEGVSGATIRIVSGADTVSLSEQPAGTNSCVTSLYPGVTAEPVLSLGCYRGVIPGGVQSGMQYELVADLPEFGRITGSTRVPSPPTIKSPVAAERISASAGGTPWPTMLLDVEVPPGAQRVEVSLGSRAPNRNCAVQLLSPDGSGFFGNSYHKLEESRRFESPFLAHCTAANGAIEPIGELPAAVVAMTLDSAYARFARMTVDEFSKSIHARHARAGIDRGVGYFTGAARAEIRIVLVGSGG